MVVVYTQKRGRKRGVLLVAGEDYHALARRRDAVFTFSPDMVVVYTRKRGRKRGVLLVAGEDYHALARRRDA
uniref:Uncharacterized protein n=1 Tax=Oryza rufipogon TaxID=4529 RepID=A0A0E0R925_ORYRU